MVSFVAISGKGEAMPSHFIIRFARQVRFRVLGKLQNQPALAYFNSLSKHQEPNECCLICPFCLEYNKRLDAAAAAAIDVKEV